MTELSDADKEKQGEAILQHFSRRFEYPWIRERRLRRRSAASRFCALTGFWGMLTGFALFITVESHRNNLRLLGLELLLALLAALVIDWLRERAAGSSHASFSWTTVLSTVFMLGTFEMFILAVHSMAKEHWGLVASGIFGVDPDGLRIGAITRGQWNLAAFVMVWVALAGLLAFLLGRAIDNLPAGGRPALHAGVAAGLKATVVVSMAVFAVGLLVRLWPGQPGSAPRRATGRSRGRISGSTFSRWGSWAGSRPRASARPG